MSRAMAFQLRREMRPPLIAAVSGTVMIAILAILATGTAFRAYLGVALGWATLPVGALALIMMMRLVGGAWREDLAVPFSALCRILPYASALFLPVLIGVDAIYPWTGGIHDGWSAFKSFYLNDIFFALRTLAYFAIWIVLARMVLADVRGEAVASAGLIVYAITTTLAAVDWALSLQPDLSSSIFGLIVMAHEILGALALAVLAAPRVPRPGAVGGLLMAAILLWAYLHAMQFIIVWSGDLPEEIHWYIARSTRGWQWAIWVLFLGQGAVPFLLLLSSRIRASLSALRALAALTLAMRLLEGVWLTLPSFDVPPALGLACVATAAVCCGGWIGSAVLQVRARHV